MTGITAETNQVMWLPMMNFVKFLPGQISWLKVLSGRMMSRYRLPPLELETWHLPLKHL